MNWKKDGGSIKSESNLHFAKIVPFREGYLLDLKIGVESRREFDSDLKAEKWAETRMNEFKREFILSLIEKRSEDMYELGNDVCSIIGGRDGDEWRVYGTKFVHLFEGTLEDCKNYIVSWLLDK